MARKGLHALVYPEVGAKQVGDIKRSDIVGLLDKIEDENGAPRKISPHGSLRREAKPVRPRKCFALVMDHGTPLPGP
jgi:hypothetical protein